MSNVGLPKSLPGAPDLHQCPDRQVKKMTMRMPRISKQLANRIRPHVTGMEWDQVRDYVDQLTGGELSCKELDLLTDWTTDPVANGSGAE